MYFRHAGANKFNMGLDANSNFDIEDKSTNTKQLTIGKGTNLSTFHQNVTVSGNLTADAQIFVSLANLPTTDPGVAGQLWRSGNVNLKISLG